METYAVAAIGIVCVVVAVCMVLRTSPFVRRWRVSFWRQELALCHTEGKSYTETWLCLRAALREAGNDNSSDILFPAILVFLSQWNPSVPLLEKEGECPTLTGGEVDALRFELGCYVFVRMDIWLFMNERTLRQKVLEPFLWRWRALFAEALQMSEADVKQVVDNRVVGYGEILRQGRDPWEWPIPEIILTTRSTGKPCAYDFRQGVDGEYGMHGKFYIPNWLMAMSVGEFVKRMDPLIQRALGMCCDHIKQEERSDATGRGI